MSNIAFIDIESVPAYDRASKMPLPLMELFHKRFKYDIAENLEKRKKDSLDWKGEEIEAALAFEQVYQEKAAIHAEFNQIVAIAIGMMNGETLRIKQSASRFEKLLLKEFGEIIMKLPPGTRLCAHNGKEFDFPQLFRKLIIQGLPIPPQLNIMGKKPWETQLEDTMEMWGGPQWKYRISLDLLSQTLGLPSPKQEMSGDKVAEVYYSMFGPNDELPFDKEEEVLTKIANYCGSDVRSLANCYRRMLGEPIITKFEIA